MQLSVGRAKTFSEPQQGRKLFLFNSQFFPCSSHGCQTSISDICSLLPLSFTGLIPNKSLALLPSWCLLSRGLWSDICILKIYSPSLWYPLIHRKQTQNHHSSLFYFLVWLLVKMQRIQPQWYLCSPLATWFIKQMVPVSICSLKNHFPNSLFRS